MCSGKVKWFDAKKGYGFIVADDGKDAFVHYSNILMSGYKTLEPDQAVSYDVEELEQGLKAINVMIQ